MQPRPNQPKPKYKVKDFAVPGNYAYNKLIFIGNDQSCKVYCLCSGYNQNKSKQCSRCKQSFHYCVSNKSQDTANWVCLRCESKYMDPIYCPDQILLQTFFKTQPVTQYGNIVQFVFYLTPDQIKKPVEVRGLQDGRTGLAWPMHGEYFLNKEQFPQSILDIKPLLKNSNRKYRKEEAFILPEDKLKIGKNVLIFSIPKLNPVTYEAKYQIQNRGIYFIGIYSIKKLTKEELIQKTFQTSKMDKAASIQFLRKQLLGGGQLSVEKSVICLECPYMKSRIKIPIRGKECQHYTCICLDTLIQTRFGMSSRQWQCPICNSPINQPVIDMYILSILNDGSAGIKVALDANGKYEWMAFEDDNVSLSSTSSKQKKITVPEKVQPPKPAVIQVIDQTKKTQDSKSRSSMSVSLALAMEKVRERERQKKIQEQQKIQEKEKASEVQNKKQKPVHLPISINLDDDQPEIVPSLVPTVVTPPKEIAQPLKNWAKRSGTAEDMSSALTLQIVIPEDKKSRFDKQKQLHTVKERLKQNIKTKKQKQLEMQAVKNIRREEFLITDVKQLDLKVITFSEFCKKYFTIEYNRNKVNEDLKNIFKEVI